MACKAIVAEWKPQGQGFKDKTKAADIRLSNIQTANDVSDAIHTSLAPRGMDKMIKSAIGEVSITNDGATILKQMNVLHPVVSKFNQECIHLFKLQGGVTAEQSFGTYCRRCCT